MILTDGFGCTSSRAAARQFVIIDLPLQGCPQITTRAMVLGLVRSIGRSDLERDVNRIERRLRCGELQMVEEKVKN